MSGPLPIPHATMADLAEGLAEAMAALEMPPAVVFGWRRCCRARRPFPPIRTRWPDGRVTTIATADQPTDAALPD